MNSSSPLVLKRLSPSEDLVLMVEKCQTNFDAILQYGGGPKGDAGEIGNTGLPGATGKGEKGDQGKAGSIIYFESTLIVPDSIVPGGKPYIADDIVIDNRGYYFKIQAIPLGLKYVYQFDLSSASAMQYFVDQNTFNPPAGTHFHWVFDKGGIVDNRDILMVKYPRDGSYPSDTEYLKLLLGLDICPDLAKQTTQYICNVLPDDAEAVDSMTGKVNTWFAQLGLKNRNISNQGPSADTVWFIYRTWNSNRELFSIETAGVSTWFRNDMGDM